MKKILYLTVMATLIATNLYVPAAHAEATSLQSILITEIQTGGLHDATEEFVELYNPRDEAVDITGWQLQYRAASGAASQAWPASSTKATIACANGSEADCTVSVMPHSRVVLVHTIANIAGAFVMGGGFSDKGGEIRLVQPGTVPVVHDMVGYGTAMDAEGTPAPAPLAGQTIKRIVDTDGTPIDTDNNNHDFIAGCGDPSPGQDDTVSIPTLTGCVTLPPSNTQTTETPPVDTPPTEPSDTSGDTPSETDTQTTPSYLPLLITEVFADPASPQSDNADEFIELYNPHDTAVTLDDYRLQTGTDYRYSYTLGDTPLAPHAYVAITSAVSKLSLANSGSGVRLLDPNGTTVVEAPNYGDAKEGQSWMQDETGWHWSLTPTPNMANVLTLPAPKVTAATNQSPKKTSATKISAPKVTSPKTTAPKVPSAKKTTSPPLTTAGAAPTKPLPEVQYWLLAVLGVAAVGYVVYEYRDVIMRGLRKLWNTLVRKKTSLAEQD